MARKKISEYKAKKILHNFLKLPYNGVTFSTIGSTQSQILDTLPHLDDSKQYVIKVDQGIKGRMKKGLVALHQHSNDLYKPIADWHLQGYTQFIIEESVEYEPTHERYLAFERERDGIIMSYSLSGGINIEQNKDKVKRQIYTVDILESSSQELGVSIEFLKNVITLFDEYYFSFLEINPLVISNGSVQVLDLAVEVDDAAEFFVKGVWDRKDYIDTNANKKTEEEKNIEVLARDSQASLKLDLFNPDGAIFLLLSGGGASIVLADEAYNDGYGKMIANYGEYSGNPNDEETYTYTKNVLSLLLKSKSKKKVLVIAGGVANFTDIRKTFAGIIRALRERSTDLQQQNVKVFVRRGGPYQKEGLQIMKEFLEKENLYGFVSGPEMVLTDIVKKGIENIK